MKFIHIADMHFDVPFTVLNRRNNLGEQRRLEQRDTFKKIIEYIKEAGYINDAEYVKKLFNEYMNLKSMSIREIKNKVYAKGVYVDYIEDYISENRETLEEYELNSAKKLIDKKKRTTDQQKLKAYLLNKGFMPETLEKIEKE